MFKNIMSYLDHFLSALYSNEQRKQPKKQELN